MEPACYHHYPYSQTFKLTEWDTYEGKNARYYNNPPTVIPLHLYRDYTAGYWYGGYWTEED